MSDSATVKAAADTWVDHGTQNKNYGGGAKLRLRSDATGNGRRAFLHLRAPFEPGMTILAATLRVYMKDDWSGGHTIKVRRISQQWKENRVTWANQPDTDAASEVSFAVPAAANDGDEILIDVASIMQDVSSGDPYHGLRLELDDDTSHAVYSSESPAKGVTPKLDVTWTEAPYPPSNLAPARGQAVDVAAPRLTWRFTDRAGSTTQGWSQVQVSASSDFTGGLLFDSGKIANTRHDYPLAGHYALGPGDSVWWRVRVWDADNFASGYSAPVEFERIAKGDLTMTNPPIAPGNVVEDLTPPVIFTFTGATLDRVRLILSRVNPNGSLTKLWEFKEQAVPADFDSITIPEGYLHTGATFRLQLFAWDDSDRVSIPGDPAWYMSQRDFTYERDGTPDPVDTLVGIPAKVAADTAGRPKVRLTWTRAAAPDWFCLVVDGVEVIHRIDPADVQTGTPGEYQIEYWRASGNEPHDYQIEAVVSSGGSLKHSAGNPVATVTTDVRGKWLVDEDDSLAVQIADAQQPDLQIGESGETKFPIGARRPVRRTDAVRGNEGSISGVVKSTAHKDDFLELKGRMKPLRYLQQGLNIPVRLGQSSAPPRSSTSDKDWWIVSTELFQIAEFFHIEGQ